MTEPTDFRRSEDDGVLTITFTRDAKLNAVSPAMIDGLRAAVDDLDIHEVGGPEEVGELPDDSSPLPSREGAGG